MAEGNFNLRNDDGTARKFNNKLMLPRLEPMELIVEASPRRVYANAHTYHINSISVNSDQETFISSDDLRVNLWHHEVTSQSYSECCFASSETNGRFRYRRYKAC